MLSSGINLALLFSILAGGVTSTAVPRIRDGRQATRAQIVERSNQRHGGRKRDTPSGVPITPMMCGEMSSASGSFFLRVTGVAPTMSSTVNNSVGKYFVRASFHTESSNAALRPLADDTAGADLVRFTSTCNLETVSDGWLASTFQGSTDVAFRTPATPMNPGLLDPLRCLVITDFDEEAGLKRLLRCESAAGGPRQLGLKSDNAALALADNDTFYPQVSIEITFAQL